MRAIPFFFFGIPRSLINGLCERTLLFLCRHLSTPLLAAIVVSEQRTPRRVPSRCDMEFHHVPGELNHDVKEPEMLMKGPCLGRWSLAAGRWTRVACPWQLVRLDR